MCRDDVVVIIEVGLVRDLRQGKRWSQSEFHILWKLFKLFKWCVTINSCKHFMIICSYKLQELISFWRCNEAQANNKWIDRSVLVASFNYTTTYCIIVYPGAMCNDVCLCLFVCTYCLFACSTYWYFKILKAYMTYEVNENKILCIYA